MLLEEMRLFLRDERRHPDRRLKTTVANLFENALHVAAKRRAGLQPIAHRGLIPVVNLHVRQTGRRFGDEVEIVQHLFGSNASDRSNTTSTSPSAVMGNAEVDDWRRVVMRDYQTTARDRRRTDR